MSVDSKVILGKNSNTAKKEEELRSRRKKTSNGKDRRT